MGSTHEPKPKATKGLELSTGIGVYVPLEGQGSRFGFRLQGLGLRVVTRVLGFGFRV